MLQALEGNQSFVTGATTLEPNIYGTFWAPPTAPPPLYYCKGRSGKSGREADPAGFCAGARVRGSASEREREGERERARERIREREHRDARVLHRYCRAVFGSRTNVRASAGIKTENTPVLQKWAKWKEAWSVSNISSSSSTLYSG